MKLKTCAAVTLCVLAVVDLQVRAYSGGPAGFMGSRNAPVRRSGVTTQQFDLSLNYGTVSLGQSLTKTQTLVSLCDVSFCFPIDYYTAEIGGDHAADFTLLADTCSGASVPTGSSCSMSIRFTPSLPGVRTAYLVLDGSAGNAPLVLTLTGSGSVQVNPGYLSQASAPWGTQTYDHSTRQIRNLGCALSSLAMALNFAGVTTDPGLLNTALVEGNGFSGSAVNWDPAVRAASDGDLAFYQRRRVWNDPAAEEFLNAALAAGYPVVVGVNLDVNYRPHHFVLVTGYVDGDYSILDPGHANRTTLSDYGGEYVTRGIVVPSAAATPNSVGALSPPDNVSALNISVDQRAAVLLSDNLGRRTGFDAGANAEREEIPASAHFQDSLDDDVDLTTASEFSDSVSVFQPSAATHQVKVTGHTTGPYTVTVHPFRSDSSSQGAISFPGISGPGGSLSLRVQLAVLPGSTSTIIRQASYSGTLQDIAACRAEGLITKLSVAKSLTQSISKAAAARKVKTRTAALKSYMTTLNRNARYLTPVALQILQQDGAALQAGNLAP
jgi:hypothetical protein